ETAKRMVERGLGLALLPYLAVAREIRERQLIVLEILDARPLSRSLDVIHPRQRPLSAEARALLEAFRVTVSEVGGPMRARRRSRSTPSARRRSPRQRARGAERPRSK